MDSTSHSDPGGGVVAAVLAGADDMANRDDGDGEEVEDMAVSVSGVNSNLANKLIGALEPALSKSCDIFGPAAGL